jgi:8-oxo-dGTP pyrophosphatase MutT (NUDIX family)
MYLSVGIIETVHAFRHRFVASKSGIRGARIILVDERRVLLVSHWYAPWVWTLPGGGVNKNETPEQAAIREASEETGLKVRSIAGLIGVYKGKWGRGDKVAVFYTGDFGGSLSLTPNLEIMSRSWFDIDHLPEEVSGANRKRIEAYRAGVRNEVGSW